MPLDPLFDERLRTHRAYLIRTTWEQTLTSLADVPVVGPLAKHLPGAPKRLRDAAAQAPGPAGSARREPTASAVVVGTAAKKKASPRKRPLTAREKHRKAALSWDKKELAQVGVAGPDIRTTEHTVPVDGYPDVRVRIYDPRPEGDQTPIPACVSFFGGAFRIGGIDYPTTDAGFRRRASDAHIAVVAVDYSLAPEHPYPAAVEQSRAALTWLRAEADALGVNTSALAVAGVSAGGCLAASLALHDRDHHGSADPIRLLLLEVPVLDLTGAHIDFAATRALGVPSVFAVRELLSVARTYLKDRSRATEPAASPLRAPDLSGMPRCDVFTAEYDPLRKHGDEWAHRLREAGGEASSVQYRGGTHDTVIFGGALPLARRWHRDAVASLRTLHDETN